MCRTRVSRLLLLLMSVCLCAVLTSEMTNGAGAESYQSIQQNVRHHLSELLKNLPQIHTRAMYKRSARVPNYDEVFYESLAKFCSPFTSGEHSGGTYKTSTKSPNYDEKIYRSLVSFCSQLNNSAIAEGIFDVSAVSPKYDEVIYKSLMSFCSRLNHSDNKAGSSLHATKSYMSAWNWTGPDIFPTRVHAYRYRTTVYASFTVVHTGPAFVFRSKSFQYRRIPIEYSPLASGAVQSTVNMMIIGTECPTKKPSPKVNAYVEFYLQKKSEYRVSLSIDVCQVGTYWFYGEGRRWYQKTIKADQNVSQPFFTINSGNGSDEIVFKKYENASIDVEVNMLNGNRLFVNVYLWERGLQWLIYDSIELRLGKNDTIDIRKKMSSYKTDRNKRDLLDTVILQDGVQPLVRITVNTSGKERTGQLDLTYLRREATDAWTKDSFIQSMEITQTIYLRRHPSPKTLPINNVLIHKQRPFKCNRHGNMRSFKHRRNCTIRCRAFGRDIQAILIEKETMAGAGRVVTPVKKVSYVIGNEAFAMVDMGLVSSDIDGKYLCRAQMTNGSWATQEIILDADTRYVPKVTNVSVKVHRASMTFTCKFYTGHQVFYSLSVHGEAKKKRSFTQGTTHPWPWMSRGNHSRSVLISAIDLIYPWKYFTCMVKDRTHTDNAVIWLYKQNFTYYPEPPVIDRHPGASYASLFPNGTLKVVCSVISKREIDVTIILSTLLFEAGKTVKEADINELSKARRRMYVQSTRQTLTMVIPINALEEDYRHIACQAARGMDQVDIVTLFRPERVDVDRELH